MKNELLSGFARFVHRRRYVLFGFTLCLAAAAGYRVPHILDNVTSNQIELISQDLPSVQTYHRVKEMTGGVGFLTLVLKSLEGPDHLKRVSEGLAERFSRHRLIQRITFKTDTGFVRRNIGVFLEPADLREVRQRIRDKIKEKVREANPFDLSLRKEEPRPLDLSDFVEKYREMGRKGLDDDYYISRDQKLLLLLIRPTFSSYDLDSTRDLLEGLEKEIAEFNASNDFGARLEEGYGYDHFLPAPVSVTYGWTGIYRRTFDDSEIVRQSLVPTSVIAFFGILGVLLLFLRRVVLVFVLMVSLSIGVLCALGLCSILLDRLNVVSAMMGSILLGLGVDFGIHYIYRLREEVGKGASLDAAIETAIANTGGAAATSAVSTSAALFVLCTSDFRGFSDFGLVAGFGLLLIALAMFVVPTVVFGVLHDIAPRFTHGILASGPVRPDVRGTRKRFPASGLIITISILITAAAAYGIQGYLGFDYDARSLLTANQPSIVAQLEIDERFRISSSPAGVATDDLAATRTLIREIVPEAAMDVTFRGSVPERGEALLRLGGALSAQAVPAPVPGTERFYVACRSHLDPTASVRALLEEMSLTARVEDEEQSVLELYVSAPGDSPKLDDFRRRVAALEGVRDVRDGTKSREGETHIRLDLVRHGDLREACAILAREAGWELAHAEVSYNRINRFKYSTFDAAVSIFLMYPPHDWQVENAATLAQMKKDARKIQPDYLEDEVVQVDVQGPSGFEKDLAGLAGVKQVTSLRRQMDDPVGNILRDVERQNDLCAQLTRAQLQPFLRRRGPRLVVTPSPSDIETFRIVLRLAADPRPLILAHAEEAGWTVAEMPMEGTRVDVRLRTNGDVLDFLAGVPGVKSAQEVSSENGVRTFRLDLVPLPPAADRIRELARGKGYRVLALDVVNERDLWSQYLELLEAKPLELEDYPTVYLEQFQNIPESKIKGYVTFIYPLLALWDGRDLIAFSDQAKVISNQDEEFHATGVAILFAYLAEVVLADGRRFTLLAALLIFIVLFVDFRKLLPSFLALIPLIFSLVWLLGLMPLLGVKVNFFNILVFPIVLGYGVDSGIHMYHRFAEGGSALDAVASTGRAIFASSVTTIVGWAALLYTEHKGLRSVGTVASLGLVLALLASLTVMPAILQVVERRRANDA